MNYTDSFAHNVPESGQLSGPIFDFIKQVSTSSGFGMIQKDDYPDDDCVEAIISNLVDLCVGPYLNISIPSFFMTSSQLYKEQFILVVRPKETSFSRYFELPYRPFHWTVWLLILVMIITISGMHYCILPQSVDIHGKSIVMKCFILIKRVGSIAYHSVLNFVSGSITRETDKPRLSEKLVVSGFIMFTFFVLVAIGGTTAASYVTDPPWPEHKSLHDLTSKKDKYACIHEDLKQPLISLGYPLSALKPSFDTDFIRIEKLAKKDKDCDGAIISRSSLEMLRRNSSSDDICSLYPLVEEDVLVSPVVIPMSNRLGKVGRDLLSQTNNMISKGYFADLFNDERDRFTSQSACKLTAFDDIIQLQPMNFILPIIIAAALASMGLIAKLYESRKDKMFQDVQQQELQSFETLSPSELFENLSSRNDIDRAALHKAFSMLPDRSGLHDICRDILEGSPSHKKYLECHDLFELYWAAQQCNDNRIKSIVDDAINIDTQNDHDIQRQLLIDLIMKHKSLKDAVLKHLNYGEDNNKEEEINALLPKRSDMDEVMC